MGIPADTKIAVDQADRFLQQLQEAAPSVAVDRTEESRLSRAGDRWPEAAKWSAAERERHLPAAVISPSSVEEVSEVLKAAQTAGIAVVPYGAGSGVVGGVVNDGVFVSLDLARLAGVPAFDDERGEVTVGAGMLGADLEAALNARGRRIPHYPQSLSLASVGGLVATRSSGTFSSKYGNIEDLLVALEVVLADGTIVRTRAVPRSSTGPSIAQLFVGSEGTLGVITAVTLRTFPLARDSRFRGIAFDDLSGGLATVRSILDAGVTPAVIRLYDGDEAAHLYERSGVPGEGRALLILGHDGHESVVASEESVALAAAAAHGGADLGAVPGETWERTRFDASWLERGNAGGTMIADAIEVSAGWPELAALHGKVLAAMDPHVDKAYAHYSHFYPNGGAIYFIFFTSGTDRQEVLDRYRNAWDAALSTVSEAGGSVSHHHGVGEARKDWMYREHGNALQVLNKVKAALDPAGVLSPGKLGLAPQAKGQAND
ncbi:FAD-binding oxidoreductase [Pseudarthrobacter sp. GA104]|uniref:FAD-binding oxidoreductase n=1 Tax=Pseudarthrobacter sp. GA104 TaxID=2676311 RepID=UPI0012FC021B|nr:FAD-binding oxidoreductase [Pseudarthrobacter sp. GA104]MUU69710.1 FAD-binding protein [Pseudarthrobacter sp. GA104]